MNASERERARAKATFDSIREGEERARKEGFEEPFAHAASAVLAGRLFNAVDRIERLEGDIKLLTELLAIVESRP